MRLPSFEIEKKYKRQLEVQEDIENHDFLRALCLVGFKKLRLKKDSLKYKKYTERVKYELENPTRPWIHRLYIAGLGCN